jgi:transposase InsO family protein
VTSSVLFFIHLGSRKVHVAGVTPHPHEAWMVQVARNVTMEAWGCLSPGQYLIHDRDTKFCPALQQIIDDAGVERVVLPPRSPNLNAYAERWVRSVAYLLAADNSIGPLLSRLRGTEQPVVRPRHAFSAPRSHLLARL